MNEYLDHSHSCFFIFIRGLVDKSDLEILEALEIKPAKPVTVEKELVSGQTFYKVTGKEISVDRDTDWVHIMDNQRYDLWHSEKVASKLQKLGKSFDIFACMVGDSDHSFEFYYYKGGILVRKFVAVDSTQIAEDFGQTIPYEEQSLRHSDELVKVLSLAESIGVNLKDSTDMKFYSLLG